MSESESDIRTSAPSPTVAPARPTHPGGTVERPPSALPGAVAVLLGGYLIVSSLTGSLAASLLPQDLFPPDAAALLLFQMILALIGVICALLVVPGSIGSKAVGILIVVVAVVVCVGSQMARLGGEVPAPLAILNQPGATTTANGYLMGLLGVGAAWLLVRRARLGWLTLIPALAMIVIPSALVIIDVPIGYVTIFSLVAASAIGLGVLAGGRPFRR